MNKSIEPSNRSLVKQDQFSFGDVKFPVVRHKSTFWATLKAIADYFDLTERTVERHIHNYFEARKGSTKGTTKFVVSSDGALGLWKWHGDLPGEFEVQHERTDNSATR